MLGARVTVRKVNNRVLVTNRPKARPGELSPNQVAYRAKFLEAANYAKGQMADDASKAMYTTGITGSKRSAFHVALGDYLKAPKVNEIRTADYKGAVGDLITIEATDDFKVTRVRVIILGKNGTELERGEAIQYPKLSHIWKYTATVENPSLKGSTISVTAFDTPENETTVEKVM